MNVHIIVSQEVSPPGFHKLRMVDGAQIGICLGKIDSHETIVRSRGGRFF